MARSGIGVVFIDFQPTFAHTKIQTSCDGLITAILPREPQTRPKQFWDVEILQQIIIFQHFIGGMQVHQMQFVGGVNQLLLGTFRHNKIAILVGMTHFMPAHCFDISCIKRCIFIEPFTVKLSVIFHVASLKRKCGRFWERLRLGKFGIIGLNHPAENVSVVESVVQKIALFGNAHQQFTRPLLTAWQTRVNHILLHNTNPIFQHIGNNRYVPCVLKLSPFLPN